TRFSLEEDQIPAAANSRASAFKQCRSFHLIPLKAYAAASCLLHAIALGKIPARLTGEALKGKADRYDSRHRQNRTITASA
ncbi:MAG: hypothetical protein V2B19_16375, partial [Pseudomonadota bacterium]